MGCGVEIVTATPLSQTNFFPDLMHVYFFPATVLVIPAFEQVVPEIVAAFDSG